MRITDDRYTRDRLRLDLALRLIRHEARTRTIRSWTGLTDDRIRKLYRSYVADAGRRDVRRHRGKSPRQSAFFMRNAGIRREAAGLATLLCILGLLKRESRSVPGAVEQLRWGERFCEAYETFAEPESSSRKSPSSTPAISCARSRSRTKSASTTAKAAAACSSSCATRNGRKPASSARRAGRRRAPACR